MLGAQFKANLRTYADTIGIDRVGCALPDVESAATRFRTWVSEGRAGEMWYLTEAERMNKRMDLARVLPGIKSVISIAVSYAPSSDPHPTNAKYARYAWGRDYHHVLQLLLEKLAVWIREHVDCGFEYLSYVDTGPILERALAERAGVGWIGKNTCVIDPNLGSYFVIGELLTNLPIEPDAPAINRCGTCTRCLDACPTQALTAPYQLDSRKCISYQTIEQRRQPIPEILATEFNGWVAGCDICQEVCPWNQEPLTARIQEFSPLPHTSLTLEAISTLSAEQFTSLFGSTSLKRIGASAMRRNARVNLDNVEEKSLHTNALAP